MLLSLALCKRKVAVWVTAVRQLSTTQLLLLQWMGKGFGMMKVQGGKGVLN